MPVAAGAAVGGHHHQSAGIGSRRLGASNIVDLGIGAPHYDRAETGGEGTAVERHCLGEDRAAGIAIAARHERPGGKHGRCGRVGVELDDRSGDVAISCPCRAARPGAASRALEQEHQRVEGGVVTGLHCREDPAPYSFQVDVVVPGLGTGEGCFC